MTSPVASSASVDPEAAVELLRRMLEIPSPSGGERELAEFLAEAMSELGLAARVDEVGNAIGETGTGAGPTILLVGHLDAAPGVLPVRVDEGRLYGRGAADAKGPLAAMVLAAARARELAARLVVAGAVEEETPESRGAHHLARTLDLPGALIVGEPSGWSGITIGYKGKLDVVYRVRRPATHPTNPIEKATEAAARFWAEAVEAVDDGGDGSGHASFDRPAATLCSIQGDLEAAKAEICVRTPPGFDTDGLLASLRRASRGGKLEVLARVGAVRAERSSPVVQALSTGIRTCGGRPQLKVKTATSDINVFAEYWSVPMATYGPGDSRLDHAADEHIELDEYLEGIDVLGVALAELRDLLVVAEDEGEGSEVTLP